MRVGRRFRRGQPTRPEATQRPARLCRIRRTKLADPRSASTVQSVGIHEAPGLSPPLLGLRGAPQVFSLSSTARLLRAALPGRRCGPVVGGTAPAAPRSPQHKLDQLMARRCLIPTIPATGSRKAPLPAMPYGTLSSEFSRLGSHGRRGDTVMVSKWCASDFQRGTARDARAGNEVVDEAPRRATERRPPDVT